MLIDLTFRVSLSTPLSRNWLEVRELHPNWQWGMTRTGLLVTSILSHHIVSRLLGLWEVVTGDLVLSSGCSRAISLSVCVLWERVTYSNASLHSDYFKSVARRYSDGAEAGL